MSLAEHRRLVQDVIAQRMDATSRCIATVLSARGASTLKEVATAMQDGTFAVDTRTSGAKTDDRSIRQSMLLLTKHGFATYDSISSTYTLDSASGLLSMAVPVLALPLSRSKNHGDVSSAALQILHEYHDLPLDALLETMLKRSPCIDRKVAVSKIEQLKREGYICPAAAISGGVVVVPGNEPASKRSRTEVGASSGLSSSSEAAYQVNLPMLLISLRHDVMLKYFGERFTSPMALKVLSVFLNNDIAMLEKGSGGGGGSGGARTTLPPRSEPLTMSSLCRVLGASGHSAHAQQALSQLTTTLALLLSMENGYPFMTCSSFGGPSSSGSTTSFQPPPPDAQLSMNYIDIVQAVKQSYCEEVISARHGLVGIRITKVLTEHQVLEDRYISEETLTTLADVRSTLAAMHRDTYVSMVELPKGSGGSGGGGSGGSGGGDKSAQRNGLYLWSLTPVSMTQGVRTHLAKALRTTMRRLADETISIRKAIPQSYWEFVHEQQQQQLLSSSSMVDEKPQLSAEHAKAMDKYKIAKEALGNAILGLMEKVLVFECL